MIAWTHEFTSIPDCTDRHTPENPYERHSHRGCEAGAPLPDHERISVAPTNDSSTAPPPPSQAAAAGNAQDKEAGRDSKVGGDAPQQEPSAPAAEPPKEQDKAPELTPIEQLIVAEKLLRIRSMQKRYQGFPISASFMDNVAILSFLYDDLSNSNLPPDLVSFVRNSTVEAIVFTLAELLTNPALSMAQISCLAGDIRTLAPATFDDWVDVKMRQSLLLNAMIPIRQFSPAELQRTFRLSNDPSMAIDGPGSPDAYIQHLVAILHVRMVGDLQLKNADELMQLDIALADFVTARKIARYSEKCVSLSNMEQDVLRSIKLREQAKKYDDSFLEKIASLRALHNIQRPAVRKDASKGSQAVKDGEKMKASVTKDSQDDRSSGRCPDEAGAAGPNHPAGVSECRPACP